MKEGGAIVTGVILTLLLAVTSTATEAATGLELLQQLNEYPHARQLEIGRAHV